MFVAVPATRQFQVAPDVFPQLVELLCLLVAQFIQAGLQKRAPFALSADKCLTLVRVPFLRGLRFSFILFADFPVFAREPVPQTAQAFR